MVKDYRGRYVTLLIFFQFGKNPAAMQIPRKAVEWLSRNIIIKRKIRTGKKVVPLFVTPDAQLKYWKPGHNAFNRDLINLAEKHLTPDSVIWDVGANVGEFSFVASAIAHRGVVVSIEADIWLASILRKTTTLKEHHNRKVHILPAAISNENSAAPFLIAARGRASNALEKAGGRSQMGGIREKQYVPTLTLDTLLNAFPSPDFVKIDVEGAEFMALQGGTRLISLIRPRFYIEVGPATSKPVFEIFRSADYHAFGPRGKRLLHNCARNTFFVPAEKC